ncbi:MAG: hypothetical protein ACM3ZC_00855 [Bacteroidota bacterium]
MISGSWEYHVVAGPVTRNGEPPDTKTFFEERYYKVKAMNGGQVKHILVSEKRVEKDGWGWLGKYLNGLTPEKVPDVIDA